jgi:hypothetical protein
MRKSLHPDRRSRARSKIHLAPSPERHARPRRTSGSCEPRVPRSPLIHRRNHRGETLTGDPSRRGQSPRFRPDRAGLTYRQGHWHSHFRRELEPSRAERAHPLGKPSPALVRPTLPIASARMALSTPRRALPTRLPPHRVGSTTPEVGSRAANVGQHRPRPAKMDLSPSRHLGVPHTVSASEKESSEVWGTIRVLEAERPLERSQS